MRVESLSDESSQVVEFLIRAHPLGLLVGLAVIVMLRWVRSRRTMFSQVNILRKTKNKMNRGMSVNPALGIPSVASVFIDVILWLYLLVHYEGGMHLNSFSRSDLIFCCDSWPSYSVGHPRPCGPRCCVFCLGRWRHSHERLPLGHWPVWLQLGCRAIFPLVLLWLAFRWVETG